MGAFAMPAQELDTDQRVRAAQAGDLVAFESLYRAFSGRVYAICKRLCGDQSQAEDLSQETFVRAWQKLGSFEAGTNFKAWLSRVAVNTSLSGLRAQTRRGQRETTVARLPETPGADPGRCARATNVDLERAILSLPPSARRIFVLHDVEGYRHGEIAQMLDLATGTSKAQLHRARTALRKALTS